MIQQMTLWIIGLNRRIGFRSTQLFIKHTWNGFNMALTVAIETAFGLTCAEAHVVIREFRMEKEVDDDGNKSFTVSYGGLMYMDESSYTEGKSPVTGLNYSFALDVEDGADQENLLKQCYVHLKAQDGFEDAIDA